MTSPPGPPSPAPRPRQDPFARDAQRMGWLYATAINFAAVVAVFTFGGYLLDRWLKTGPWILIAGLVLGLVGGTIKFIRDGLAVNRQITAEIRHRHDWKKVEDEPEEREADGEK